MSTTDRLMLGPSIVPSLFRLEGFSPDIVCHQHPRRRAKYHGNPAPSVFTGGSGSATDRFEALAHAFWNDPELPESKEAVHLMAAFLTITW